MSNPGFRLVLCVRCFLAFLLISSSIRSQQSPQSVNIQVQVDQPQGAFLPIWNYFGYDEPNYTYATHGTRLLAELAADACPLTRLPRAEAMYGIWQWDKLWKRAGLTTRPR
jgi:hypothetical protein